MPSTPRHPHRASRRSATTAIAAAAAVVLTVSGCAAGQISQTAQQVAAIDGGNATVGSIGVRNVLFETPAADNYGPGSTVPVSLVISNAGIDADTLTGVTSAAAASVTISGDSIALPGQHNVQVGSGTDATIELTGITRPLCFGQSMPLTFTFAKAGSVTVRVPIANPQERRGSRDTIDIQPPHPTPVWLTGAEGHGGEADHGESGSGASEGSMTTMAQESSGADESGSGASASMSGVPATAAPATACNGY